MDTPEDNPGGKIVSLDFARRAREAKAFGPAPEHVRAPVVFTGHEVEQLTRAFEIGREAGVLERFELKENIYTAHFNMIASDSGRPAIQVSRDRCGKLVQYKCWSTYGGHQTVGEGNDFTSFLPSVRYAVRDMIDHVRKRDAPGP